MADDSRIIPFELAAPYVGARRELAKARRIIDSMTTDADERRRLWRLFLDAIAADE